MQSKNSMGTSCNGEEGRSRRDSRVPAPPAQMLQGACMHKQVGFHSVPHTTTCTGDNSRLAPRLPVELFGATLRYCDCIAATGMNRYKAVPFYSVFQINGSDTRWDWDGGRVQ